MVLETTPLPALPAAPAREGIEPRRTKKAVLLALYRAHPDYGDRTKASRVAAELAPQAGLQPGTARSYLYAELDGRTSRPRPRPLNPSLQALGESLAALASQLADLHGQIRFERKRSIYAFEVETSSRWGLTWANGAWLGGLPTG